LDLFLNAGGMMKDELRQLYRDQLVFNIKHYQFNDYLYFLDETQEVFGVKKNALTEKEVILLSHLFEPIKEEQPKDDREKLVSFLFGEAMEDLKQSKLKFYLLKVFNHLDLDLQNELDHLLKASYNNEATVIKRDGIIIILTDGSDKLSFVDLLSSIESDFMIKLIGYESEIIEVTPLLPDIFQMSLLSLKQLKYTHDVLISQSRLILHNLLLQLDDHYKKNVKRFILKSYVDDHEMLNLIKVYFENNFNTTVAAKNCYMHRNTVINKLDKFNQETAFNLRHYEDALMVYLAITM
jgi:PucR C-terminal helix-turn-helix domain